mmetsp:Transcript_36066/g.83589  ORF Transcript_36066/g.83589 Transcript_36066/m.83589 type:complete len:188 (+) Transcript_36066:94-657(+)
MASAATRFLGMTRTHLALSKTGASLSAAPRRIRCRPSWALGATLGDVERVVRHGDAGATVPAFSPLLTLSWQGLFRSSSDELYHATFESIEGETEIRLPFPATIVQYNDALLDDLDAVSESGGEEAEVEGGDGSGEWLVEVEVEGLDVDENEILDLGAYKALLSTSPITDDGRHITFESGGSTQGGQ